MVGYTLTSLPYQRHTTEENTQDVAVANSFGNSDGKGERREDSFSLAFGKKHPPCIQKGHFVVQALTLGL